MQKIVFTLTLLFFSQLEATTLNLKSGWNLVGSNRDGVDINKSVPEADTVWKFKNGWLAISPNGKYSSGISALNLASFSTVDAGEGFWIQIDRDKNITLQGSLPEDRDISISTDWNLISLKGEEDINISKHFHSQKIKLIWKYKNGWLAYSPHSLTSQLIDQQGLSKFESLKVGEGFWVLGTEDLNITFEENNTTDGGESNTTDVNISVTDITDFGVPTQGGQYGSFTPELAIDDDNETYNHTSCDENNWWQLDFKDTASIYSLNITGRSGWASRIEDTKVYISDQPYYVEINETEAVSTLQYSSELQQFSFSEPISGRYLIVKGDETECLHMRNVDVFGKMPTAPRVTTPVETFLVPNSANGTEITTLDIIDYQGDSLTITTDNSAFIVDENLTLKVVDDIASGVHTIEISVSDGREVVKTDIKVQVSSANAVDEVLSTGDISKITTVELLQATIDAINETKVFGDNIRKTLLNLDDENVSNDLNSLSWDPTHDSSSIIPTLMKNRSILLTNGHRDGGTPQEYSIAVVGEDNSKYTLFGGNPLRNTINEQMGEFIRNTFEWLSGRDNFSAEKLNVVISQTDDSYYFKDDTKIREWLDSEYGGNVTYNSKDSCDNENLQSCLSGADILIISQIADEEDIPTILASVQSAIDNGVGILYVHHDGDLKPLGSALFDLFNVTYEKDLYWTKATLDSYDNTADAELSSDLEALRNTLSHIRDRDYNFDFSLYLDSDGKLVVSDIPDYGSQFGDGASVGKEMLNLLDQNRKAIFKTDDYRTVKLLTLVGDALRREVEYPMDRLDTDQNSFLASYLADHLVYNFRDFAPVQPDMGNFSRSDFSHITPIDRTINIVSKRNFRSTGVYAIPSETVTIRRDDNSSVKTEIQINSLRSGATHEFNSNGYLRPKYLTSQKVEIKPHEEINITSVYGGPIHIFFDQNDVNTTFTFQNIGEHPYWRGSNFDNSFAEKLDAGDFDWAEIATEGFEVHSTLEKMRETIENWYQPTAVAVAEATEKYLSNYPHVLAGFQGEGIDTVPEIYDFANENNLTIPIMDTVKHMNADQATCGYGCSGNPYDAYWAFNPIGHGDIHELGHGLENRRLGFEGWDYHGYTNPYSYYSKSKYNRETGDDPVCQNLPFEEMFVNISTSGDYGAGSWNFDVLSMIQAGIQAEKFGELENGWHIYPRMHLLQRAISTADDSNESFESMKNGIGFSQYSYEEYKSVIASNPSNDWTLISLSFASKVDFRNYLDMMGITYSQKAGEQVESFNYPETQKIFFVSTPDGYCQTDEFGSYFDKAYIPVDGNSSWVEDSSDPRLVFGD
jgi:hypothetical protein